MIDYKHIGLFGDDSVDKQFLIVTDDNSVAITNTELHEGAFELTESISSEDSLVFGSCAASSVKFTASNVFSQLKNKWITVYITLDHDTSNSFKLGRYKVYSDSPTADRKKRNVEAYDALYDVLQANVAEWYNTLLPNESSTTTLKAFRNSFFSHFGIEQEEITLINDDMVVAKTIQPEELSGKVVLNAICEINGCFGHIGRNGKFKYIYLQQSIEGLYPAQDLYPSEDLYPRASNSTIIGTGSYIPPCTYEDYKVKSITGLQIRQEENDIAIEVGTSENQYTIEDNFLVYGKGADELKVIAERILEKIREIVYRPFDTKAKGNPCIEVGDAVRLNTKTQRIESYVLQRVLSGIQALRDTFSSSGTEYVESKINSFSRSINQIKGKQSKLERTADRIELSVSDLEKSTKASIEVLYNQISLKVSSGQVVNEINISTEAIALRGNRLIVDSTNFKLDKNGNAEFSGTITGGGISLETEEYEKKTVMKTQVFSSGNTSLTLNEADEFEYVDIYGPVYILGGSVSDSFLGVSEINCSNIEVGGDVSCSTLNGSTPVTSSNISGYLASLEARVSALEGGSK